MLRKVIGKGKGIQLRKQLDALNETIGTKLKAIKARQPAFRQGLADNAIKAYLLQDALERFNNDLKSIFEED